MEIHSDVIDLDKVKELIFFNVVNSKDFKTFRNDI